MTYFIIFIIYFILIGLLIYFLFLGVIFLLAVVLSVIAGGLITVIEKIMKRSKIANSVINGWKIIFNKIKKAIMLKN